MSGGECVFDEDDDLFLDFFFVLGDLPAFEECVLDEVDAPDLEWEELGEGGVEEDEEWKRDRESIGWSGCGLVKGQR